MAFMWVWICMYACKLVYAYVPIYLSFIYLFVSMFVTLEYVHKEMTTVGCMQRLVNARSQLLWDSLIGCASSSLLLPFRLQLFFNTNFYFIINWKSMFMHTSSGWCTRPPLPPSPGHCPQHVRDTLPTLSILRQSGYYIKLWASEFPICYIQSWPSYIRIYYIKSWPS